MTEYQLPQPVNSKDFANLLCDLFNEKTETHSFKCFEKNGHNQKGIDILSTEKDIIIQAKCKDLSRKHSLLKRELYSDIDETIKLLIEQQPNISFKTLYFATTFGEHPDFDGYCEAIKTDKSLNFDIVFWGWDTIQRELINSQKALQQHYPKFIVSATKVEQSIVNRLGMKKKIEKDFSDWLNYAPENRIRNSKMILHSIDDKHYPEHEKNAEGEYQWFGAEIKGLSHKGLEFITSIEEIYVNENFQWTCDVQEILKQFTKVKVAKVSIVDFEDIVDYDIRGDEHYMQPHFFCKFRYLGKPFKEEYFLTLDKKEVSYYIEKHSKIV
jgi:hypothetical protein